MVSVRGLRNLRLFMDTQELYSMNRQLTYTSKLRVGDLHGQARHCANAAAPGSCFLVEIEIHTPRFFSRIGLPLNVGPPLRCKRVAETSYCFFIFPESPIQAMDHHHAPAKAPASATPVSTKAYPPRKRSLAWVGRRGTVVDRWP